MARWRRDELEAEHSQRLREAIRQGDAEIFEPSKRFEFPEPGSIRGVPLIGHGVRGAIRGTVPHQDLPPSDSRG
jgi:hypothetical protein